VATIVDLQPGDVIRMMKAYWDGDRLVFAAGSIAFVIAVFEDPWVAPEGTPARGKERVWLMPAGETRYYDLQQWYVRANCKRLTKWTTEV
jgi:hypothetical protein